MAQRRCLFWHRKDLRINDNLGLSMAISKTNAVTGVYIFDPTIYTPNNSARSIAPSQKWFLSQSLIELQSNWKNSGSQLIFLKGDPVQLIPNLALIIKAELVIWNKDVEPYSIETDNKVYKCLEEQKCEVSTFWDHLLVDPNIMKNLNGNPYQRYTPFWNKWHGIIEKEKMEHKFNKNVVKEPKNLIGLDKETNKNIKESKLGKPNEEGLSLLNKLNIDHNFTGFNLCPCKPGEEAGNKQLSHFFNSGNIYNYSFARDIPSLEGTSNLSAAFKFGTISSRKAWEKSICALHKSHNKEDLLSVSTWQKEIAWKEFYQNALLNFPSLSNGCYRSKWKNFPWQNNINWFNLWKVGQTGVPIIDAAMRQLNTTGWMHNRCRMIVASFLVKDLICDWRMGEAAFMEKLVDGDIASNNGGWQWTASTGMDTKPLRIFNPINQARKFDKHAIYIRKWLPEISHVSNESLITGNINSLERNGYPPPIIDHNLQQKIFKNLYARI